MRKALVAGVMGIAILGGCSNGKVGLRGSPLWYMQASEREKEAFLALHKPYDDVMISGQILTSEHDGYTQVTEVKYEGKLYTCFKHPVNVMPFRCRSSS